MNKSRVIRSGEFASSQHQPPDHHGHAEKRKIWNPRSGLFERGKQKNNLTIQLQASLPLTAGHRGHWRWGGESPEMGKMGGIKEGSAQRPVATGAKLHGGMVSPRGQSVHASELFLHSKSKIMVHLSIAMLVCS
jgi:hypothetical protein